VEKYGRVRQAIDDNVIWQMSSACWIKNAIDNTECAILILSTAKVITDTCRNTIFIHTFPVMYIFNNPSDLR